jgi:hypothetical protein
MPDHLGIISQEEASSAANILVFILNYDISREISNEVSLWRTCF